MRSYINNINNRIKKKANIQNVIVRSHKFTLPGFNEVPVYDIIHFIYQELKRDDLPTRANSVAFSFFLSLFPLIIFILPLLSLTPWAESYISQMEISMDGVFPQSAKNYLLSVVNSIKSEGSYGLQGVGFILSVIFASSGMLTLMYGFDKSYENSFKSRSYFKKRLVALNLTLLFSFIVLMSLILIVLGQFVLKLLVSIFHLTFLASALLVIFKWIMVIMLFYSVITVIYRYGPSTYKPLKWINPGATLATCVSLICSIGFSYFINNFDRYNEIYGSIGALIVILLWLQFNAFIILAGFELNASIIVNRDRASVIEEGLLDR